MKSASLAASPAEGAQRRAAWMRTLTTWHWVSSAICLIGMLFFAATGITLNNAEYFERQRPAQTHYSGELPPRILQAVNAAESTPQRLPDSLIDWVKESWDLALSMKAIEWQPDEVYVDLKRPGVDASLTIDRHNGAIEYLADDHGWVAYFNDLHKGKNAGRIWSWLITAFGVGCVVFSITGLLILQIHARSRWQIWPLTGLGFVVPLLLLLLFVH